MHSGGLCSAPSMWPRPGNSGFGDRVLLSAAMHMLRGAYVRMPGQRAPHNNVTGGEVGADHPCHDRDIGIILHRR